MKRLVLTVLATVTVALFGWVTPAQASPITYTESATLSGTIGCPPPYTGPTCTTFTNALVTLTLISDTANVITGPGGLNVFQVNIGPATIDIAGVGFATFTDVTEVLSTDTNLIPPPPFNNQPTVMFATWDTPPNDGTSITGILAVQNAAFLNYDLGGAIGPVSGPGFSSFGGAFHNTSSGILHFTSSNPTSGTFTATTSSAPVPEPASIMLLGTGVVTLVGRRFRQRT